MSLVFAGMFAASVAAAAPNQAQPKLLVPDLVAERGIDEALVRLLNELLLTKFQEANRYVVIGSSDIVDMLEVEQNMQLMGCESTSCLAEIGGALGVDLIAKANIGRVGAFYLINLKLLDVATAQVVGRSSKHVDGEESNLIEAVHGVVEQVLQVEPDAGMPQEETAAPAAPGSDTEQHAATATSRTPGAPLQQGADLHEDATKLGPTPFYVAAGVTVAAALTGIVFELQVQGQASKLDDDPTDRDAFEKGKSQQKREFVALGIAGAGLAASAILFMLTDFDGDRDPADAATTSLAPWVAPTGVGMAWTGGF